MKPRRRVDLATIILHMPPVSNEVANQSSSQIAKSSSGFASEMHPGAAHAFWQILTLFDSAKLSTHRAFRNALGVVLPLIAGFALNMPRGGLVVASGALNVSYSDGSDPYSERVKRMLASSVICAVAVFVGAVSGKHIALAVTLASVWAFIAGMFVAVSGAGPDLGIISLVTLLIYAAQRLSPREAAISGVLALAGGLLQTALSAALWPVRRYDPERRALEKFYLELANRASASWNATSAPLASSHSEQAQEALLGLARDGDTESIRVALCSIRLNAFASPSSCSCACGCAWKEKSPTTRELPSSAIISRRRRKFSGTSATRCPPRRPPNRKKKPARQPRRSTNFRFSCVK
jgi:hypothetical protein